MADPRQHCSISSASTCTARYIRAYFQNGTLPEPGTECDPNYDLFEQPSKADLLQQDEFASAVFELSEKADFSGVSGFFM